MGVAIKVISALLIVGGLWVWFSGRSVTEEKADAPGVSSNSLGASAIFAVQPAEGAFDEEGTIILDLSQGEPGVPYILYTDYNEQGKPSVKTKRLIFKNQAMCAQKNLPCASDQPDAPVTQDQKVRIIGTAQDETVTVESLTRLSS